MKQILISLALLFSLYCTAQIETRSSLDANSDGSITTADVDGTKDGVLGKLTDETRVVTTGNSYATLTALSQKLSALQDKLKSLEKMGTYNYGNYNNEHEYVDLGLSVKWATCNVGAVNPEDFGLLYAWGETTGYSTWVNDGRVFNYTDYKWMTSGQSSGYYVTKYTYEDGCTSGCWYYDGTYVGTTIDGTTYTNKTVLDPEDDAATANWGEAWRMPTNAEWMELKQNCYWEFTSNYGGTGVNGYYVYKVKSDADKGISKVYDGTYKYIDTSKTSTPLLTGTYSLADTHIFIPNGGFRRDSGFNGYFGNYWASDLITETNATSAYAYAFHFTKEGIDLTNSFDRFYGFCVRAVCK